MSTIRELSRLARRVPVVRRAVEAGDPRRRAERLARLGIVDAPLYAAQLGVPSITVEDAAMHYATVGFRLGYTLNVLTDPFVLRRSMIRTDRPALYDYFNSAAWHARTTEVWSVARYVEENPEALEHPAGPVGHLWERVTRDPSTEVSIESGGAHPVPWSEIYPVLRDATAEWAELERDRRERYPRRELTHAESLAPADTDRGGKVSIVMPVWNRGGAMRRAVESIIAQTWSDWELLIVDDGSWDDTVSAAELLASRDSRIRVLKNDHQGVCAARNAGIAAATGDYVAFLDSDNTWLPTFLHDMVTTMTRESMTTAYATIAMEDEAGTRYRYGSPSPTSLLRGNSIDLNTLVARRDAIEAVGGFDPTLRRAVDYDLILKLAAHAPIRHVPTLGARYDNSEDASDRISTTEAFGWNTEVRLRHSAKNGTEGRGPDADTTVVCLVQRHDAALASKFVALTEIAEGSADVRIVAVGVKPDEWRNISAYASGRDRVSAMLHQSGEPFAYVVERELRRSTARVFGVIDPLSLFTAAGVRELVDEVSSGRATAVIPLTVSTSGTVESMGSLLVGSQRTPVAILGGHPIEDARRLGPTVELRALSGRSAFVSRAALSEAGGLDPLLFNEHEWAGLANAFEDRSLAVRTDVEFTQMAAPWEFVQLDPAGTASALRSRLAGCAVTPPERWYAPLDMRVPHWRQVLPSVATEDDDSTPEPQPELLLPVVTRDRKTTTLDGRVIPRLRWAIKTASPSGPVGESWGDTHFGRALADALTALGQDAVVDAREAQHRETEYLDDVVVHLRGLDEFVPSPGSLSYLWVISHPDMVAKAEAQRFDRVFAASLSWSADVTRRWSLPVEPLLQCTDPDRFRPTAARERDGLLFVGNSRGIPRPTVMESVRGGLPLELYGGDWERFVPAEAIAGSRVDNAALGEMYAGAAVVLNDHWADMQREGFISNRLFDVVAAGGRVYSDTVPGIDEIFQGAVQTYRSVSEIIPFLSGDLDAQFPDEDELARISAHIRAEHSFATRARVLLEHAIADLENTVA